MNTVIRRSTAILRSRYSVNRNLPRFRWRVGRLCQLGRASLEFTVLLPLLCLLLLGITEFSFGMYNKAMVVEASREAVLEGVAVPRLTPLQLTSIARNYASDKLITFGDPPSIVVDVNQSSGTSSGNPLKVTVSYAYNGLAIGRVMNMLGETVELSGATTMNYQ
ncbi:TadE/TadG family type IV pilus assembly protein [Trinickia fusca]|nr:TadE/TadG family type IV pilus assembly protein [Trinickia fusca]